MDAKPQRPVRTLRIYDENALPVGGAQKTIHQRNKSSPALSSLSQAGALKAAAKRTAFGDLSNTANFLRPSKDDSVIGAKAGHKLKENLQPIPEKQTTFQKPAQRPATIGSLKSLLNNVTTSSSQVAVKLPVAATQHPIAEQLMGRKIVNRKSVAVLTEHSASGLVPREKLAIEPKKSLPSLGPIPPVHRELPRVQNIHREGQEAGSQANLRRTRSKYLDAPESQEPAVDPEPLTTQPDNVAPPPPDGVSADQAKEPSAISNTHDDLESIIKEASILEKALAENHHITRVPLSDHIATVEQNTVYPELARRHNLPPVSEPEEYWEEEEIPETYEEDGYVTARSFKSRGDNTTGGATTILFPKMSQRTRKEIALAKEMIEGAKTVEELEDEAWDTTMVAEYGDEIFEYMRNLEVKMLPNAHYMDNQAEIQWSMRAVLMDWIVQVHHRFNLLPETLFLCVNYIDRFLSCKVVSLGKLQLVGATAIFIAAKYEEIDCPSVQEIVYMVDNGYSIDEILKAERFMLTMLQFELGWPGPMSFLRRISKADDYDLETRTLAKYFLELTIVDERFVGSPPSFLAAGAHCLARMMLRKGEWSPAHVYYSNYTYSQLYSIVLLMVECCEDPQKHHAAIYEKYMDRRYKRASTFAESEMRRGFQLLPVSNSITKTHQAAFLNTYDAQIPEIFSIPKSFS
ncbi:uncharacterized protein KY384_004758 [Bacidia gigantensis]|uniref:uncharacterized protein n=1 Tax=Bacidia gigantensis TaxID=2732470 RepID=UPI001D058328|nr:uncharacterized protein KY384_004758 [Bacidia gigantensis]KAG8530257.1 hypothetical protein KY384_004758 [Bacidia gigantensis]